MREIKFRAWDETRNKMLVGDSQKEIALVGWSGDIFPMYHSSDMDGDAVNNIDMDDYLFHRNIKLMQYTGIKDKNGVEIYEGDVVKSICVVDLNTTEEYIGVVEYPKDDCGFYLKVKKITNKNVTRDSNYYTALKHHANEVIGNIYENKEWMQ